MKDAIQFKRRFIIGEEWIYFKIYTGSVEDILEVLRDSIESWLDNNLINKWFFIRYADPHHHLRLRFHITKISNLQEIIVRTQTLLAQLVMEDIIWRLQLDTYDRELERYGTKTIHLSEELFYFDSKMVINFIDLIDGEEGEEIRWLFCLRAIDDFLNAFRFDVIEKIDFFRRLKAGYGKEFRIDDRMKRTINGKYRDYRKKIEYFMNLNDTNNPYRPLLDLMAVKRVEIQHVAQRIYELNKKNLLEVDYHFFIESHVHMMTNRIFQYKNRLHELVCYDFLYKYYMSVKSRTGTNRLKSHST